MPDSDAASPGGRERVDRTVDEALRLLLAHDMAGFADLWASDGVLEIPFAPGGPTRLEGRDTVRDYLAHYTDIVDVREVTAQRRHHTLDPDTVVLEFETDCVVVASGTPVHMQYIAVITTGPEGIVAYRDFWNPLVATSALGADEPLARGATAQAQAQAQR